MYIFLLYLCCLPQKSLKNITFEKDKENIYIYLYKLYKKKKIRKIVDSQKFISKTKQQHYKITSLYTSRRDVGSEA